MEVFEEKNLIKEAINVLNLKKCDYKYFRNTEFSKVILINDKYVMKITNNEALKAEVEFLENNTDEIFPKIVYVDNEYNFFIYQYVQGNTMREVKEPIALINDLKNVISSYKCYENKGFGYMNEEVDTWEEFLKGELDHSKLELDGVIKDYEKAYEALEVIKKYKFIPKLLHGDFGTHNFIENVGKLVGVIDPMPVIGDSLYDLLFAIVSNIDIIYNIELQELYQMIDEPQEKIKALLVIVLYARLGRCKKHHKNDLIKYRIVWDKITK